MKDTFSIIFFPKGKDLDKNGQVPIYVRITVNGQRKEFGIKRKIALENWNSDASKMMGKKAEAIELNRYIDSVKSRIYKIQEQLMRDEKKVTAKIIKDIYQGKDENLKMLIEIFDTHNAKIEKLAGKEFALGTIERYKTAKKHVEDYIKFEYKQDDIPVKNVNHKFITGLEYYLKTERDCAHNTTLKYIANFKKIIRIAYANDWIAKDPFLNYKLKLKQVTREYLTQEEIQILTEKSFRAERLELVKDIFLFSCFTGLAYVDVQKITPDDIILGIDGHKWIKTTRTKTKSVVSIPILPLAMEIIEKYKDHPEVRIKGKLLPILTNQKMNAYLKEIADVCGINKNLTFHVARHTFATTVTLTNGVPIESVSKMLGHNSLKTTQHYAKILDRKVSDDMQTLRERFSNSDKKSKSK
ncbi:Site-specific recombinase XerD [Flavobacteriaceae bacterium MAR_2010_188]|nr:Site-specific recombinase XerD [Flavobacteriaceae bacterium MAR_2010_188]